ncbi:MAG: ABC transporter ATP-binding protein [Lachnospiraceae bacterium]|nr:ABC transporter ATP-binding protein [Lachnospiraceae bacterium]
MDFFMAMLTIKQLSKRYDREFVFGNINLQLEQKEFLVVVGEDGCGKTTFMKLLAGLEEPSQGEIFLDNEPVYRGAPAQSDLAVVFEKSALYQDMTVYQNIAYALRLKKCAKQEIKERVEQAMDLMSVTELSGRKPKKLTEEQSQRVMLARAIAKKPKLLLLDEPFRGFGREAQKEIHQCLNDLYQKMDTIFVYATRLSPDVNRMATQILHLEEYCQEEEESA